jgi:hypothetical protein
MADLSEQIEADALKPQSVSNDGVSVSRRSLSEQIEADKYLASKAATASPAAMFRSMTMRIVPPGGH